ncbi:Mak10 subunit, NatC N-terminal acetyltransferase-domain-containing protein [Lipomyces japonicus]|uniref:Mak10 subunit, NatC N-terminal acetyltransferase-domain-containing protein n=1 Tax=Lipomyces japonicus TaxID=56871 RepID=UPI0034CDB635
MTEETNREAVQNRETGDLQVSQNTFSSDNHYNQPVKLRPLAPTYVDVTELFISESTKLKVGELAMHENFQLANAINALEVMDIKMDTGLIDMNSNDYAFDTAIGRKLSEIIWVMDKLLALEMAWFTGSTLTQTIFTCIYVEQALINFEGLIETAHFGRHVHDAPKFDETDIRLAAVHFGLRSYILSMIKFCEICRIRLQQSDIKEDEDVSTHTYSLDMLQLVPISSILEFTNRCIDCLKSLHEQNDELNAIIERIELRQALLLAVEHNNLESFTVLKDSYHRVLDLIPNLKKTHALCKPLLAAFSVGVQGRLECIMPPWPVVDRTYDWGIYVLTRLANGMLDIQRIRGFENVAQVLVYFDSFSFRQPTELPFVRMSLLALFLSSSKIVGKVSVRDAFFDDVKDLCCPSPSLFEVSNQKFEQFITKAEICYTNLFSLRCQNKSRYRQSLCRALLDWDSLQVYCENLESSPSMHKFSPILTGFGGGQVQALPLSSWVYFRKLEIMINIIFLGFELDIYRLEEWKLMLWYGDYVLGKINGHLQRLQKILDLTVRLQNMDRGTIKFPQPSPSTADYNRTSNWLHLLRTRFSVFKELCHAYICLVAALSLAGIIQNVTSSAEKYSTPELLYKLRLKPFSTIGAPELPQYLTYADLLNLDEWDVDSLLDNASTLASAARKQADQLVAMNPELQVNWLLAGNDINKEHQDLVRSCIGLSIAISVLKNEKLTAQNAQQNQRRVKLKISHERFHHFFPILMVSIDK